MVKRWKKYLYFLGIGVDKPLPICYYIGVMRNDTKERYKMKIDRRIKYFIVLDTETANGVMRDGKLDLSDSLVYDLGWAVVDKRGKVYKSQSVVISDIFYGEAEMMKSAYYGWKRPIYEKDLQEGRRSLMTFYDARQALLADMVLFDIDTVCAHNAQFDYNALNNTQRWLTKSKYRYFFPYGTIIWDSLSMAKDTINKQKTYTRFCDKNGYKTKHKTPRNRLTAEILYRYISGNNDFLESHTGLEDVLIEKEIVKHCFRQHKKMRKTLFK